MHALCFVHVYVHVPLMRMCVANLMLSAHAEPTAAPYLQRIKDLDAPEDPSLERPPCIDMRVQVRVHKHAAGAAAAKGSTRLPRS
jgi:hypothetical protein